MTVITDIEVEVRHLINKMDREKLMRLQAALIDNADDPAFDGVGGQKVWNKYMDLVTEALLQKVLQ